MGDLVVLKPWVTSFAFFCLLAALSICIKWLFMEIMYGCCGVKRPKSKPWRGSRRHQFDPPISRRSYYTCQLMSVFFFDEHCRPWYLESQSNARRHISVRGYLRVHGG